MKMKILNCCILYNHRGYCNNYYYCKCQTNSCNNTTLIVNVILITVLLTIFLLLQMVKSQLEF